MKIFYNNFAQVKDKYGLFRLFKKPTILQDAFWGPLLFVASKDASKNHYEGKGYFSPAKSLIEYIIKAGTEGPTDKQKQFYLDLQADFPAYTHKIKPLIENEFRNWKENFFIKDFNKEFKIVHITIPRLNHGPASWDMVFETVHDANHQVIIDFIEDQPRSVLIDG
ncbi:MAG: hypothetical protein INR73_00615 [Williamsia sp.]|nr:hypothetical protein [Williamsia sp.]